jgi:hypothetical protein
MPNSTGNVLIGAVLLLGVVWLMVRYVRRMDPSAPPSEAQRNLPWEQVNKGN